jgi:hypothetical protein
MLFLTVEPTEPIHVVVETGGIGLGGFLIILAIFAGLAVLFSKS